MALPLLPLQQCAPFSASPPSTPLRAYVPPSERGDGDGGDHGNVEDGLATAFVHNYCSINSSDGVGGGDGDGDAKAFDREDDGTPKTVFGDVDTLSSIRFDDSWLETAKDGGALVVHLEAASDLHSILELSCTPINEVSLTSLSILSLSSKLSA